MNKSVFYLEHRDSGRRLKWYKTLTGARIAQKLRNSNLGFGELVERELEDDREICWYKTRTGSETIGTWIIVEDVIDSADLLD